MAVSIIEQIISSTNANRPGGNYTKSYITIHETGNKDAGAGAKNHANWLSNGANGEIGYHYTVDDHEIYHHIPDNEKAWHAGDGGLGTGNLHSIGIELCVNADGDFEQTKKNAAWLVAKLMKDNSIPIGNVVQHNHWSGKNCPQTIRETGTWDAFLAMCQAEYDGGQPSPAPAPSGDTYTVQAGDCLSVIGAKLGLDWRDIAAVNGITEPYTIYAGQVLQLSGGQPAPAPAPVPAPQPSENTYTVVSGDSLSKIGAELGINWQEIAALNGIGDPYIIYAGQVLALPDNPSREIQVGDQVRIICDTYSTGQQIPSWVKDATHVVSQVGDGKLLLGANGGICSWVPAAGVVLA